MKRIFSSYNLAAAHHVRNLLEADGIRAVVKNEILASAMGELPPGECQVEVWVVNGADLWRAERLLGAKEQAGACWACTSCGEQCEPQFTQCWRCGSDRKSG